MKEEVEEQWTEEEIAEEEDSFRRTSPGKIFLVVLLFLSLLYISGIREMLFYRRTPESARVNVPEAILEAERLEIPVSVFVVREGEFRSTRSKEEIDQIISNGFKIFAQANIGFEKKGLVELHDTKSGDLLTDHRSFLSRVEDYDEDSINIFLVGNLRGLNGVAFPGNNSLAVADYVTSRDHRILAHEIGHILGLGHSDDPSSVMYQGSHGMNFSLQEIITMREEASSFSDE